MRRAWFLAIAALAGACRLLVDTDGLDTQGAAPGRDASADGTTPADAGSDAASTSDAPSEAAPCDDAGLLADPRNCGRCGHDCSKGSCNAGECQPFVVVSGTLGGYGVAAEGDTLYYSVTGQVRAVSLSTGMDRLVANVTDTPAHLAQDATYIYAASANSPGHIVRVPKQGGAEELLLSCPGYCEGIAFRNGLLYIGARSSGAVGSMPADGGSDASLLVSGLTGPEDLDVDDQEIFIADENGGQVVRAPVSGGATTFVASVSDPVGVAIDGPVVYVTNQSAGSLLAVTRGDGGVRTVASSQSFPTDIAVTPNAIYWGDRDRIMGLAK